MTGVTPTVTVPIPSTGYGGIVGAPLTQVTMPALSDTLLCLVGRGEILCGTDALLRLQYQNDSDLQELIDIQEEIIRSATHNTELVIPIVVHVVHPISDTYGNGVNISLDQINSQIDALNIAFQASTSGLPDDITFCLAQNTSPSTVDWSQDNFGNYEPGIMRYPDVNNDIADQYITIASASNLLNTTHPTPQHFPFDKYLNIWVVNSINNTDVGITQGYAPLPILPETGFFGYPLDGVVVRSDVFGDNSNSDYCQCFNLQTNPAIRNQGKVLVHEVGHYLRLYHTFFDGCLGTEDPGNADNCKLFGDYVCDTPPCQQPNSASQFCTTGQENSCIEQVSYPPDAPNTNPVDRDDLIEDYMYYTQDPCWQLFTEGQVERMIDFIVTSRQNLVSPQNLSDLGVAAPGGCVEPQLVADFNFTTPICVGSNITFTVLTGPGFSATTWDWDFGDGNTIIGTGNSSVINTFTSTGVFTITLTAIDGVNPSVSSTQDIFVSACTPIQSSQGNWYFGHYAGLNFSTGTPIADQSAFNNLTIDVNEGCVTQSDDQGILLFYSDGVSVWNSDHEEITTFNLSGGNSATQHHIVPAPGNADQYYLFQVPNSGNSGLFYSIVDMSLPCLLCPSNGYGQVTTPMAIPIQMGSTIAESITAVPHCNGRDYWIICHEFNGQSFLVYLLSGAGLTGSDGVSTMPDVYSSNYTGGYGSIKASPDGTRITVTNRLSFSQNGAVIYDFDNSTGVISNQTLLMQLNTTSAASFSPNSDLLYISGSSGGPTNVYQFDLIGNTNTVLYSGSGNDNWSMQLGPDGKIYLSKNYQDNLAVINSPNTVGPGAAYSYNGPALDVLNQGIVSKLGIVNMMDAVIPPFVNPDFSVNYNSCSEIVLDLGQCWNSYNVQWDFGDGTSCGGLATDPITCGGTTGTFSNPNHTYSGDGIYTITANLSIGTIFLPIITHVISIQSTSAPSIIGPAAICIGGPPANYSILPEPGFIYQWNIVGGTFAGGQTTTSGTLVSVDWNSVGVQSLDVIGLNPNSFCPDVTSALNVTVNATPALVTSAIDACGLCSGEASALVSGGVPPYAYNWGDGQTTSSAYSLCQGPISVTVSDNNGCAVSGLVNIEGLSMPISANVFVQNITGCSGNANGIIQIIATGGSGSLNFSIDGGVTFVNSTGIFDNLLAGSYDVFIMDPSGCIYSLGIFQVDNPLTGLSVSVTTIDATCSSCDDGEATVSTSGGVNPFIYLWDDPLAQITPTAVNLSAGTYNVTVTDFLGCEATTSITIGNTFVADFDIPTTCLAAGTPIAFDNTSSNPSGTTFSWLFGDNTTSTLVNPTHVYMESGIYEVTLAVFNPSIGTIITSQIIQVVPDACACPDNFSYTAPYDADVTLTAAQTVWSGQMNIGGTVTVTSGNELFITNNAVIRFGL